MEVLLGLDWGTIVGLVLTGWASVLCAGAFFSQLQKEQAANLRAIRGGLAFAATILFTLLLIYEVVDAVSAGQWRECFISIPIFGVSCAYALKKMFA